MRMNDDIVMAAAAMVVIHDLAEMVEQMIPPVALSRRDRAVLLAAERMADRLEAAVTSQMKSEEEDADARA